MCYRKALWISGSLLVFSIVFVAVDGSTRSTRHHLAGQPMLGVTRVSNSDSIKPQAKQSSITIDRLNKFLSQTNSIAESLELSAMSNDFLLDEFTSRKQKVEFLLSRISHSEVFGESEKYCCALLTAMKPVEFANQIIDAYSQVHAKDAKSSLIFVLKGLCISDIPPEEMEPGYCQQMRINAPIIQDFLGSVLYGGDITILSDALDAYCALSPPNESVQMAFDMVQMWLELDKKGEQLEEDFNHTDVLEQLVKSGLATPETQDEVFPELDAVLGGFSSEELSTFNQFLYRVLSSADLTETAKIAVSRYLEEREPQPQASSTYFHWVDAITKVSGGEDPILRLDMIADRIRNSNEPLNIASVVVYGPTETLACFTKPELDSFRSQLDRCKTESNGEAGVLYATAIEAIDEYNAGLARPTPQLHNAN